MFKEDALLTPVRMLEEDGVKVLNAPTLAPRVAITKRLRESFIVLGK